MVLPPTELDTVLATAQVEAAPGAGQLPTEPSHTGRQRFRIHSIANGVDRLDRVGRAALGELLVPVSELKVWAAPVELPPEQLSVQEDWA